MYLYNKGLSILELSTQNVILSSNISLTQPQEESVYLSCHMLIAVLVPVPIIVFLQKQWDLHEVNFSQLVIWL